MAVVPFPLTATDPEDTKSQLWELIRQLYEDKVGGADLGDVFAVPGDVLTLVLADHSGLTKTGNELSINPTSTGGLTTSSGGALIKIVGNGGLETNASGAKVKCKNLGGLASDSNGLYFDSSVIVVGTVDADMLLCSHAAAESHVDTTPTEVGHIKVSYQGEYRVKFDLRSNTAVWKAYGQIYKNGVAHGTLQETPAPYNGWTTFTEDLTFAAGDAIQLYTYSEHAAWAGQVQNFEIYSSFKFAVDLTT